jgi:Ca2+/H+ antiporter
MSASAEDPLLHMASPSYTPPDTASPAAAPAAAPPVTSPTTNNGSNNLQRSPFDASASFSAQANRAASDAVAINVSNSNGPAAAGTVAAGVAVNDNDSDDDDVEYPQLSLIGALFALTLITITVAACSEFLTGAIEAVSESSGINQAFLGLIVLPIAGNACEHITAVFVAVKNKMDLAISVALGSSIQIATFVLPVTVLAGWAMGKELTMDFDPFATLMCTVSVILAYFVSSDGTSNWLLGLQLVVTYVLIGLTYLLEDESQGGGGGGGVPPSGPGVVGVLNVTMGMR